MEKSKTYSKAKFTVDKITYVLDNFIKQRVAENLDTYYQLSQDDITWTFDDENEFYASYRNDHDSSYVKRANSNFCIKIRYIKDQYTNVSVQASSRGEIESVFSIFEDAYPSSQIHRISPNETLTIFIGHGRSRQWKDLKDHLSDFHHHKIEAYESGPRAGYTITEVLSSMVNNSSFAVLVMTGEDREEDGSLRARQNVVHEIGLFQGRLGFNKTVVLLEEGTEEFSNISGVQQIRYAKGNIKETYGDVLATIKREFKPI